MAIVICHAKKLGVKLLCHVGETTLPCSHVKIHGPKTCQKNPKWSMAFACESETSAWDQKGWNFLTVRANVF